MDGNSIDKVAEELQNQTLDDDALGKIPENKLTQTDHVNKRLLDSFLERLNQNDNSIAFGLNTNSNSSQSEFDDTEFSIEDNKESNIACEEFECQNLHAAAKEEIPENKPSQTDHINKKLLDSFLERLNQNDNSVAFALNDNSNSS
ncbi:hypothetical protein ElyMa_000187500 [Elysia marginata]|uniref:Uncharacterized protein n=1 Tax=Elysia marginata TaxID=1093978 RepID=A0AAV4EWB7_9GAST|nr:hypothetical protein ElyMa_000187500 [Elysia marginata]